LAVFFVIPWNHNDTTKQEPTYHVKIWLPRA
jgi:hypothetical protein